MVETALSRIGKTQRRRPHVRICRETRTLAAALSTMEEFDALLDVLAQVPGVHDIRLNLVIAEHLLLPDKRRWEN
jgi:hypothetical protein